MGIRALVVGGTSGTGYALACRLAAEPTTSSVIISGRNKPASLPYPNMHFRALDASSMRSIQSYTDAFKASEKDKLDYLILSQGILTVEGRTETPEGIDRKMALHYYGRELLIRELLPSLAPDAKVISVLDGCSGKPANLKWDDLDLKTNYSLGNAANHCIVMNDAMVQHFATTQQPGEKRHFIHTFPGLVKTNLGYGMPWYLRLPARAFQSVAATKPEVWVERLWSGLKDRVQEGENEGKLWHNIDQNGNRVEDKHIFTSDELSKITGHTKNVVDAAILSKNEDSRM